MSLCLFLTNRIIFFKKQIEYAKNQKNSFIFTEQKQLMSTNEKLKWDYRSEINKPLIPGTILLSEPFMDDPNFIRSVCLMVSHIKNEGSFGLILNKKSEYVLSDFINDSLPFEFTFYTGGPVALDTIFFLHDNELALSHAKKINEELYWNGDFNELLEKLKTCKEKPKQLQFFLGYSGWDAGQLRKEIIENTWIVNNDFKLLLDQTEDQLWQSILKDMGGIYKQFSTYPIDPSLN